MKRAKANAAAEMATVGYRCQTPRQVLDDGKVVRPHKVGRIYHVRDAAQELARLSGGGVEIKEVRRRLPPAQIDKDSDA